ncbi:hypothetical protein [Actinomadura sp. 6N118]|uniref:hypothetical protein n=1 Tax=Actinomadura sp. 6N118 TaxID=3375151 RepID=UPI0037B72092
MNTRHLLAGTVATAGILAGVLATTSPAQASTINASTVKPVTSTVSQAGCWDDECDHHHHHSRHHHGHGHGGGHHDVDIQQCFGLLLLLSCT